MCVHVLVVSVCRRGVGCPALTGFAVLWLSCDPAHVCSSSAHTPPRVPRASAAAPRNPHRRLATNTAASARARPAPAAVTMTYRRCFTAVTNQCFCIAGRADRTVRRRVLRPLRPVALPQRAGWFVPSAFLCFYCSSSTSRPAARSPASPYRFIPTRSAGSARARASPDTRRATPCSRRWGRRLRRRPRRSWPSCKGAGEGGGKCWCLFGVPILKQFCVL